MEETKGHANQLGFSNGSLIDQFFDPAASRMKPVHECFHEIHAAILGRLGHTARVFGIYGHGFFAKDVLPGLNRPQGPFFMQMVGEGNINRIDMRIFDNFLISAAGQRDSMLPGKGLAPFLGPAS